MRLDDRSLRSEDNAYLSKKDKTFSSLLIQVRRHRRNFRIAGSLGKKFEVAEIGPLDHEPTNR